MPTNYNKLIIINEIVWIRQLSFTFLSKIDITSVVFYISS